MRRSLRVRCVFAVLIAAITASGCGGNSAADNATKSKNISTFRKDLLPQQILGMTVQREDVSKTLSDNDSYVDRMSLYSLRSGDLLQATLQVSRFNSHADYGSSDFRGSLLNRLGGTRAKAVRVGAQTVYLSTGTRQQLAVWFKGRFMLVLASREEYERPRSLLREMLKVKP